MTVNDVKISKAFLASGDNFKVTKDLEVKHPTVKEILKLGGGVYCDDVYWNYVFVLLSDPYDNMVWLDDKGIDYEEVSAFDVFIMRWNECIIEYNKKSNEYDSYGFSPLDNIKHALSFFLGEHDFNVGVYEDGTKVLFDKNQRNTQITADVFRYITTFIQLIHGIGHNDRIYPANASAKKVLIEDKRDEIKKQLRKNKSDNDDYLGNMILAVIYGGNGGITPFNFKRLKFYQLYSSMSIEQKKSHYNHVMSGVYFGTVPFEKVNQEINWMR